MSKINKILILVFVVILAGTVGEISYYFISTRTKQDVASAPLPLPPTVTPAPLSVPKADDLTKLARERTMQQYLTDLEKGYISTAILSSYYKGKFIRFERLQKTPNAIYNGGLSVSIEVNVTAEDNRDTIVVPAATVKIMKVVAKQGGTETPIKIEDLKAGDALEIQQDYNIMETDPAKGITAFKITQVR